MKSLIPAMPVTMSSLEIVDLINKSRASGEAVVRHCDFLTKVPKVLSEELHENFRAVYADRSGKRNPCYVFPKREACLMAMSYSYELQAKVFDRMTELEAEQQSGASERGMLESSEKAEVLLMVARAMIDMVPGVKPELMAANTLKAIHQQTGVDTEQLRLALPCREEPTASLNATEAGKLVGLSARVFNIEMEGLGMQTRNTRGELEPTESGRAYGEMVPFGTGRHSGYQLRWKPSVVELFRS